MGKTKAVGLYVIIFTVLASSVAVTVHAEQPLDTIKRLVDQVVQILNDPAYQGASQKRLQRDKIWQVSRDMFDFVEIAKRTLARNWLLFTPQERMEFSDIFAELLANTYITRVQEEYRKDKVDYLSQETEPDNKALIKTKIFRGNLEIPINYRMMLKSGAWKVYDIDIEGVSLVKNYRTQFSGILIREKPGQLIQRIRKKVDEQKEGKTVKE